MSERNDIPTAGQAGGVENSNETLRAHASTRAADAAAETDNEPIGETAQDGAAASGGDASEVEGDLAQLMKLTAQRDEYLSLAQRTQADFENYKKRVAREAKQAVERGVVKLAKELLPALDNLDRAIAAAASGDPLLEGVRLVRAEISAALARVGVEPFSPLGEPFDPAVHEAVATLEQPEDGAASGTVTEVYQDGYRLDETIIRPARVVVAA
jgi:molecular chaperone GrpE